jgi:hypothetical protein
MSPAPSAPHLSRTQWLYIDAAWRANVARDHACRPSTPEFATGSPSRELTSSFAVLRAGVTSAHRLRALLQSSPAGPGFGGQELYLNQIHRARSAFGASFYVIPAGDVTLQRGVPARCGAEQVAALKPRIAHLSPARRGQILAAQRRYLAYLRYLALHPEGICATFITPRTREIGWGDTFGCATLADFQRWGVLADASAYLGGGVGAFWTVVPDGVATVTLGYAEPNGRPFATSTVRADANVVVAREPWDAPYHSGFPSTITLRSADGRVIKTVNPNPTEMITLCGYGC